MASNDDRSLEAPTVPDVGADLETCADGKAREEDRAFERGSYNGETLSFQKAQQKLDQEEALRDSQRRHGLLDVVGQIGRCALWFLALVLASMLTVWVLHVLLPQKCHWLTPSEIDKLKDILFSGALSSAVTLYGSLLYRQRQQK